MLAAVEKMGLTVADKVRAFGCRVEGKTNTSSC